VISIDIDICRDRAGVAGQYKALVCWKLAFYMVWCGASLSTKISFQGINGRSFAEVLLKANESGLVKKRNKAWFLNSITNESIQNGSTPQIKANFEKKKKIYFIKFREPILK
jgi:hypothetical protein